MSYKRILTIQDISCVGQCSLTVALPVISACGVECAVLPSAVLSNHTAFNSFTFRDLTEDMPGIKEQFVNQGIQFQAIYTGYLGTSKQIDYVMDFFTETSAENCLKIVDPAMADNGRLYTGFDTEYVQAMRTLCGKADYILPNLTEACLLTDTEYKTEYDRAYIDDILQKLTALGIKNIIFTGVSYQEGRTGIVVFENKEYSYYEHELLPRSSHGTGDIFASAFTGSFVRGKTVFESVQIAANYTLECLRITAHDKDHWYGAKFEPVLGKLIAMINE